MPQTQPIERPAETRADGAVCTGEALSYTMHGAEDRRVRGRVVDDYGGSRQSEGAARDLDEEDGAEAEPYEDTVFLCWWRGLRWDD